MVMMADDCLVVVIKTSLYLANGLTGDVVPSRADGGVHYDSSKLGAAYRIGDPGEVHPVQILGSRAVGPGSSPTAGNQLQAVEVGVLGC